MPHDSVSVRYPDGRSRTVALSVPLGKIRAAVSRNVCRIAARNGITLVNAVPQIEEDKAYHDDPFTMAEVRVRYGDVVLSGIGFAKRKASDRRNPGAGIALASGPA